MTIEIVDFPINSMVDLSIVMLIYQRLILKKTLPNNQQHDHPLSQLKYRVDISQKIISDPLGTATIATTPMASFGKTKKKYQKHTTTLVLDCMKNPHLH